MKLALDRQLEARVGQTAKRKINVGEIRSTSNGTPIHGDRPSLESFCVFQNVEGLADEFGSALKTAAEQVAARGDLFSILIENGGESNFFVGYFLGPDDSSSGFDIEPETLSLIGKIGLRLSVCLYNYAA